MVKVVVKVVKTNQERMSRRAVKLIRCIVLNGVRGRNDEPVSFPRGKRNRHGFPGNVVRELVPLVGIKRRGRVAFTWSPILHESPRSLHNA